MYQTRNDIYVWLKSDDGKKVESHLVQGWYNMGDGSPLYPLVFDDMTGLRMVPMMAGFGDTVRFSLDERDQQPLMVRSKHPAPPSDSTAANSVSFPTLPVIDPNARVEFETEHSRRVKANAQPHEPSEFRLGLVEA